MLSQNEVVLRHLKKHGSITTWVAIHKYGITRLSGVIYILRHKYGEWIESEEIYIRKWQWFFKKKKFVKYVLY